MQSMVELTQQMVDELGKEQFLFLEWDPEDIDSTTRVNVYVKIKIHGLKGFNYNISVNVDNMFTTLKLIETIFEHKKIPVIGYNFKNFFSLFRRITGKSIVIKNLYDLFWYESYKSILSSKGDLVRGVASLKSFVADKRILGLYKRVYLPLITTAIPSIESFGLRNDLTSTKVYPEYIIEGQENGRLSCVCNKKNTYNPHTLSVEKEHIKFLNNFNYFIQYDFRNMEVSVLAELSQDVELLRFVKSSEDVYSDIFEKITGLHDIENARELGKKMFLPLIYGQTAGGLSKVLDISFEQSEQYISKAREIFSSSFSYVERFMNDAKNNGFCQDVFGRVRKFDENSYYKARNFSIQSPSALICLYYLVKLYSGQQDLFSVVFNVHDGYCIATKKEKSVEAYTLAKKILEGKNDVLESLELKVSAKVGTSLSKMVPVKRNERQKI
jgi:hypothetical protein